MKKGYIILLFAVSLTGCKDKVRPEVLDFERRLRELEPQYAQRRNECLDWEKSVNGVLEEDRSQSATNVASLVTLLESYPGNRPEAKQLYVEYLLLPIESDAEHRAASGALVGLPICASTMIYFDVARRTIERLQMGASKQDKERALRALWRTMKPEGHVPNFTNLMSYTAIVNQLIDQKILNASESQRFAVRGLFEDVHHARELHSIAMDARPRTILEWIGFDDFSRATDNWKGEIRASLRLSETFGQILEWIGPK